MKIDQNTLNIVTIALMAAAFYFLLIRPQQVRQRQHADMVKALTPGDRVVTAGGLIGTITEVSEDEVVIELAKGIEARLVKDAVIRKVEE